MDENYQIDRYGHAWNGSVGWTFWPPAVFLVIAAAAVLSIMLG